MNKFSLAIALLVATSASALVADPGNNGGGNGGCGVGQQTNGCGNPTPTPTPGDTFTNHNQQAQGQAQGQIATGVGVGLGGSVTGSGNSANSNANTAFGGSGGSVLGSGNSSNDIRNTNTANGGAVIGSGNSNTDVRNTNDIRNTNTNITGPSTSTSGAISGSHSNSSNRNSNDNSNSSNNSSSNVANVNVEGDTYVNKHRRIPVSTAYAPALTSGLDTCLGSLSGGVQTGVFGVSLGGTKIDSTCQLIKLGREAGSMGMADVQCQILSLDDRFAKALAAANRSCALPDQAMSSAAPAIKEMEESEHNVVMINRAVVQPIPVEPVFNK